MNIKKVIITKGMYLDKELRLLVSFDDNDRPIDVINLYSSHVGEIHIARVEKVLKDINACILKLDDGSKGFIENKKLNPDYFLKKHSREKLVCQQDSFYVQIIQDKKGSKPYTCDFINSHEEECLNRTLIEYYINKYAANAEIITDTSLGNFPENRYLIYEDNDISLWQLYDLTKLLNKITSQITHLKNGGNICIQPTEAMTVIDINSAQNYGKTSALNANLEAVEEIAYQLRLRSISGIIVIDFLKVNKEDQQLIKDTLTNLCRDDMSKVGIYDFTKLGLLEMTREKIFSFTI